MFNKHVHSKPVLTSFRLSSCLSRKFRDLQMRISKDQSSSHQLELLSSLDIHPLCRRRPTLFPFHPSHVLHEIYQGNKGEWGLLARSTVLLRPSVHKFVKFSSPRWPKFSLDLRWGPFFLRVTRDVNAGRNTNSSTVQCERLKGF